jgi:hypothetical protein
MSTNGMEAKIMQAIEEVTTLVNGGATPTDAVVKVAAAHQLRPGYINTLVHAYNTGRTTRQREDGEGLLEKAGDFELANPVTILEQLYPTHTKTAAEIQRDTAVSLEYALDPSGMIARAERQQKIAATRGIDLSLGPKPAPAPENDELTHKKASYVAQTKKNELEEVRRLASNAFDRMSREFSELNDHLKTAGAIPFPDFQKHATMLHGRVGELVCSQLTAVTPWFTKQASRNVPCRMGDKPYTMLVKLAEAVERYNELRAAHVALEKQAGADVEAARRPFVSARSTSVLGDTPSSDDDVKRANLWNPFTQNVLGSFTKDKLTGIGGKTGPAPDDKLQAGAIAALSDPAHEAELRNIRAQATLRHLMTQDPVISGYKPHEVFSAFNDVSSTMPRAVDQRAILQAMLRQRLTQGQFSGFDLDQMLGMENKLKQREGGTGAASPSVL